PDAFPPSGARGRVPSASCIPAFARNRLFEQRRLQSAPRHRPRCGRRCGRRTSEPARRETQSWVEETWSGSRRGLCQKRVELAGTFKIEKIVTTADVGVADPDLRHRLPSAGTGPQIRTQIIAAREVHFLERRALALQQVLGHVAVATV